MQSSKKSKLILPVKLAISISLLFIFYRRITVDQLMETLASARPAFLAPMLLVLLFNSFISSVKWHIFLAASGIHARLRRLFGTYLAASFLNIFLPSNVGGDFYRIYDTSVKTADPARSTASVLADRISGFLAIVILGITGSIFGTGAGSSPVSAIIPAAVFCVLIAGTILIYQKSVLMNLLKVSGLCKFKFMAGKLDAFFDAFQEYRRHPRLFLKVMSLSFTFQFGVIFFVFLISEAINLEIPFVLFCIYVPLVSLLEAVPLSIYGLGFREAGYVFFLRAAGHSEGEALSVSLLYLVITLIYSSLGGIILATRHLTGIRPSDGERK